MTNGNHMARRNYALEADTLGEENFLQIKCEGEVLVTVSAPSGPAMAQEFIVYNGTGLDEDDEDCDTLIVKRFPITLHDRDTWREAVRYGYLHALAKLMGVDQRAERAAFGRAA